MQRLMQVEDHQAPGGGWSLGMNHVRGPGWARERHLLSLRAPTSKSHCEAFLSANFVFFFPSYVFIFFFPYE
jgi:hypothetical protein